MNMQRHSPKIMLRLWTWALCIVGLQLTTATAITTVIATTSGEASPTFQSTSIETDLHVIRVETTTASTIHLRLNDNIENINGGLQQQHKQQATAMTSTTKILQSQQPLTREAFATSSITTLASSNAPATITNQAREETLTMSEQQQGFALEKNNGGTITTATTEAALMKQFKNNNDELEVEIEETDIKQVTESVVATEHEQQHQQQITTDVNWQKETDMNKQLLPGNTGIKENVDTTTSTPTAKTLTTATHDGKETAVTFISTPTLYSEQRKNTAGDEVKSLKVFNPATLPVTNRDQEALTLTPLQDTQAMEDFRPIIKDANEKLLKEHTVFSQQPDINNKEWKQNLMPNELEYKEHKPFISKTYEHNINWSPYLHSATPVTDFTGKLLQEQDGVITEIEQKFRLNEFVADNEAKTTTTENPKPKLSYSVNHEILRDKKSPVLQRPPAVEFIERRVKKSFDFPMHRMASDAQHMQQHFDFANTKFNSNNNEPANAQASKINGEGSSLDKSQPQPNRPQPEFSTTKFYNSKELYNEMLQNKAKQLQQQQQLQPQIPQLSKLTEKDLQELNNRQPSLALNSFAVLHSPKIAKLEEIHESKETQQQQKSLAIKKVTVKSTKHKDLTTSTSTSTTDKTNSLKTATTAKPTNRQSSSTPTYAKSLTTDVPAAAVEGEIKVKKFQKELKRAKLLIKSMMPLQNTTTTNKAITATTINNDNSNTSNNESPVLKANKEETSATSLLPPQNTQTAAAATAALLPSTSVTRPASYFYSASASAASSPTLLTSTNAPKTSLHPIVRPRILSRLQEKINSLECELQNLPQDSHLWRGNETHELLLPIMTPENCKTDKDCTAMMVSWEGEAEIQSGDILIVEINDALLTPKDINLTTSAHNTQVYQVTRSGHEHCDVTEGILLDITPLIVDGRKLVTLYDKDLTEGVNLLIVVSELWGSQCVRLKVTTKTENCGENADCSGKGICFSNYDMEEYECQCCSGFAGPHCEEIDACTPSPCTNNGICVDLSQGHEGNSYQCLCPYGYTGKNCQYELDPCNPAECMNGGSCVGNSTHFRCECTPGYTGPLCQHSLNECESSPCIHGICVDQEDGFRCFCQPGFAGELCNFEYNECESNPCQNGGECIDHIGSFECRCTKGYTGNRCQIKVDFCSNKPCPEGRRCIDHGNDYSCECLGGRNGPDCNEMQRTQCNVNPCTHGGTCWSSGDSFYCACRPGYTGTMCEDEFVVETVVSSSEFMVDDTSARNFNDKSFGSSVVLKSPIELHNAYTAAIVLALVIFFVALYLTICHCKVNQTYRKFSTRTYGFLPILGFRLRTKQATSKISRHWLSGKGLGIGNAMRGSTTSSSSALHATTSHRNSNAGHLPTAKASSTAQKHQTHVGQLNERPFQRHLAMNLENDMYYTVDFSENSQHSPLIQ